MEFVMDIEKIQKLFRYNHLPPELQAVSQPFYNLAIALPITLPPSAELTLAIRKLWEAKNLAVYAAVEAGEQK